MSIVQCLSKLLKSRLAGGIDLLVQRSSKRWDRRCPGQQSRSCLLSQRVAVLQRGPCSAHASRKAMGDGTEGWQTAARWAAHT